MGLLELTFASGDLSLSVRRFSVRERISSLFDVSIQALSPNEDLDLGAFVGLAASFRLTGGLLFAAGGGTRLWSGICSRIQQTGVEEKGLSTYEMHIVPRLWLATQRSNHRIFQRLSAPDIVAEIVSGWGVTPVWNIDRPSYPKLEYRVQYGESDFDFLSRTLEEAGIAYAFVDDGKDSVLTFFDRPQANEDRPGGPLVYFDEPNQASEKEFVARLTLAEEVRPRRFTARDFDFRRPDHKLDGVAFAPGAESDPLEQYRYLLGSSSVIVKEASGAAAAPRGGGSGFLGKVGHWVAEKAGEQVSSFLTGKKATSAINKTIQKIIGNAGGGLAAEVAQTLITAPGQGIVGGMAGAVAQDLVGGMFSGRLEVDLEQVLREKVVENVNKGLAGLAGDTAKELGGLAKGAIQGAVGGVGGKVLGFAANQAISKGTDLGADFLKEKISSLDDPHDGGALPAILVGDDKGQVRADDKTEGAIAQRLLDSLLADRRSVLFTTNAVDLRPATIFSIVGHPRHDLAPTVRLLSVELSLDGTQDGEWTTVGRAVFAATPYRPALHTPRPVVHGLQSAIVVGPGGPSAVEDIHTDELGRVRVQFPWDREGKSDTDSSLWVRVSQAWAGAGYGIIALPRVGHEVLIAFLEGNPDQPMVVGRVFNVTNGVPHRLPDNKTVTAWKSASSPGGGGFNEIAFEDAKGSELVSVQAEKDLKILVKHDEAEVTERNRSITVGKDLKKVVWGAETETTRCARSVVVGDTLSEQIAEDHLVQVGRNYHEQVGKSFSLTVGPPPDPPKEGGGEPEKKAPPLDPGVMKLDVKERLEIVCGKATLTLDKSGKVTINGVEFDFSATGPVQINGSIIDLN